MPVHFKGSGSACWFACGFCFFYTVFIARGQQITPFLGRGAPPTGGTDVYVSVLLDRLLSVDVVNYDFEASLYIVLTWNDERARIAVDLATKENRTCQFPCSNLYAYQAQFSTCCDDIWLPHLEFLNCKGFPQDRVVRYAVRLPESNVSTAVAWWAQVHGKFYNPFLFKSFPFDAQRLIIQITYAVRNPDSPITFIPSSTAQEMFTPRAGDDISGWTVKRVGITPFNISLNHLMEGGECFLCCDFCESQP